jgi:hypothetical protein
MSTQRFNGQASEPSRKGENMRKNQEETRGRVLARLLAEDLRNVKVSGAGATPTVTDNDANGRRDITNVGGDGDAD